MERDECGVGFVANLRGEKTRALVEDALSLLVRLSHRGAVGADPDTGDGAGILLHLPHRFFKREGLKAVSSSSRATTRPAPPSRR